jgi:hypothetical protein
VVKRKKKKAKSTNAFQMILRSSKNLPRVIYHNTLHRLLPKEISSLYKQIANHPVFTRFYLPKQSTLDSFYRHVLTIPLDNTLAWVESIFINSIEPLNDFIELEIMVSTHILKEEYPEAINCLDMIQEMCGISIWGLQTKAFIISVTDSEESAIEFLSSYVGKESINLTNYIINSLIARFQDDKLYFSKYKELNQKFDEAFGEGENFTSFIKYKILPQDYVFGIDSSSILKYESDTSLIDLYKAYLFCLSNEIYKQSSDKPNWLESSKKLCSKIKDPFLNTLSFSLGNIELSDSLVCKEKVQFIDSYTKGEYIKVENIFNESDSLVQSFNAFEIAIKSTTRTKLDKINFISSSRINKLKSILLNDAFSKENTLLLFNESFRLSSLNWFLNQHIFLKINTQNNSIKERKSIQELYLSRSDIFSSFKCKYLNKEDESYVLNRLDILMPDSKTTDLYKLYSNRDQDNTIKLNKLDIESNRKNKYIAIHLSNLNRSDLAIEYYEKMFSSEDPITRIESIQGLITALIHTGKIQEAAKRLCECFINNSVNTHNFPIELICKTLEGKINKNISIYTPICFDIYNEIYDDKYLTAQKIGFELFVEKNKAVNFITLLEINDYPNQKIVEYFLEKIYIPNIMKGPLIFTNSDLIENTRISICQYLIENQIGNKVNLQQESKSRSKALVLKRAKIHVENTKIYVDIDYVKGKINSESRELFDTYINVLDKDFSSHQDEITLSNLLLKLEKKIKEDSEKDQDIAPKLSDFHPLILMRAIHPTELSLNEKNKIFMTLLKKVRDEFIHGIKGFSGYLSTRIKHGTLETHFRKALLDDKLLQNSKSEELEFQWSDKLEGLSLIEKGKVDELLITFSASFDEIINKVIDTWLQVKQIDLDLSGLIETKKGALFNYSISNVLTYGLQQKIEKRSTYEDFWENVINWLWLVTDQGLIDVQRKFKDSLIPEFKDIFNTLQKGLTKLEQKHKIQATDLHSAIASSRQNLTNSVKTSSRWFNRNTIKKQENYDFDIVLEIVQMSLSTKNNNNVFDNFTIPGNHLSYYVDIMYMLFSNAAKHSHLMKDDLYLDCRVNKSEGFFEIIVINSCQTVNDFEDNNVQLKKYNNIYETEGSLAKLKDQGDTGFYKIQKIIKEDIACDYICDIRYLSNTSFQVRLEIKS